MVTVDIGSKAAGVPFDGGIKVAVVQRPSPQPANHGVGVVLTCKPGVRVSGVPLPE